MYKFEWVLNVEQFQFLTIQQNTMTIQKLKRYAGFWNLLWRNLTNEDPDQVTLTTLYAHTSCVAMHVLNVEFRNSLSKLLRTNPRGKLNIQVLNKLNTNWLNLYTIVSYFLWQFWTVYRFKILCQMFTCLNNQNVLETDCFTNSFKLAMFFNC